ncbi:MAG: polyketide-type polyunsaturated fatty acid synthase PfaA, partial [Myxococcota bacterium]
MTDSTTNRPQIAVVGVGAVFPGSTDEAGFWRDILAGKDLMTDVPESHWLIDDYYDPDPSAQDKTYAKRGAFLPKVDFDPLAFGVPPKIMPATDSAQLLALVVAQRVLEDAAQGQFAAMDKERISVILGVTSAQELLGSMVARLQRPIWEKAMRDAGLPESQVVECCQRIADEYVPWQESTFPGVLGNVVAGRIANRFDLHGTNCVTDAACASTFSAVSMAVNELYLGQSDLVVTGGVDTMNDIFMYMCFSKTPALSKTGDCRPFSDQADGTMLGEGIGMVALKRLADAERDGDRIYALLKGVGSSSDGRSKSVYAPVPEGQARALKRAYEVAGHSARTVELIEAHGTGTIAGDAAEFEGLRLAFGTYEAGDPDSQWCGLGSVKSQIGHTKSAAGAAGLFKIVMALHHKVLPPTIKVDRPNPNMDLETSAFYLNTTARPWVRGSDHPRRGSVSAFGFGGSNFHLALEEYTGPSKAPLRRVAPAELVAFGADSAAGLVEALKRVENAALHWASKSSLAAYTGGEFRLAIVASDDADLAEKLALAGSRISAKSAESFSLPNGVVYGVGAALGGLGLLFPGQGSQYLGMGADVAMTWPAALGAWDMAADIEMGETTLHRVVFPPKPFSEEHAQANETRLVSTQWAQPAIGTASLALLNILRQLGLTADGVGGHSYGEVTALHAAGAMDEATLLKIARRRGELMAEAAKTEGAMTAVRAPIDAVKAAMGDAHPDVVVANHNAPKQVVLSGPTKAIAAVETAIAKHGLSVNRLQVATAFHSPVVGESTAPFAEFLGEQTLANPSIPVWANCEAAPYSGAVVETLSSAIARPVRFVEQIESMYAAGIRTFVEVGPSSILTGLVGQILDGREHHAIALDRRGACGVRSLLRGLADLVGAGHSMQLDGLWAGFLAPTDPATVAKPKMAIEVSGTNVGKPYPPEAGVARPGPNPERQPEVVVKEVIKEVVKEVYVESPNASQTASRQVQPMPAAPVSPGWAQTYESIQRQTAEAHTTWQQSMADTHMAFLRTVEQGFASIAGAAPTPKVA